MRPLHHTPHLTTASRSARLSQVVLADIAVGKSIVHVIGERPSSPGLLLPRCPHLRTYLPALAVRARLLRAPASLRCRPLLPGCSGWGMDAVSTTLQSDSCSGPRLDLRSAHALHPSPTQLPLQTTPCSRACPRRTEQVACHQGRPSAQGPTFSLPARLGVPPAAATVLETAMTAPEHQKWIHLLCYRFRQ